MRRFPALMILTAFLLLLSQKAHAWGVTGHRIVAAVAEKNLNAKAKAAVKKLLGPDTSLADVANFADTPYRTQNKGSYNWHFVDIPVDAADYVRLPGSRSCGLESSVV